VPRPPAWGSIGAVSPVRRAPPRSGLATLDAWSPLATAGRALATAGVLLAVLAGPAEARADYYSWVDEDGTLHLTNLPADGRFKPYTGPEAEGFGGQPPVVMEVAGAAPRTLYPVDVSRYDAIIRRAAEHYALPFAFVKAIAKVESNFDPRARSHADAKGLMQLIDGTARAMRVRDVYDPEQNIFGGARYLRILANEFDGDLTLAAAAYNAGPERVKRSKGVPAIDETRRYVARVKTMYRYYLGLGPAKKRGRR
jgi:hypothetical protein